jgi:regulatory protein YycI of two-component signal transduction system YycFG
MNSGTFRSVIKNHPELKNDPIYREESPYFRAFEDALLMVAKKNHLNPCQLNIEDPYAIDGCIKDQDENLKGYYDAEYSRVDLFTNDGKFRFWDIDIPIEKIKYFQTYSPSFYVRGNLTWVLVLKGDAIIEAFKAGKIRKVDRRHGVDKNIIAKRTFIIVNVRHATLKNQLKVVKLENWLKAVKSLFGLDLFF